MAATAVDSSVIVAGLLSWHEAHPASLRALQDSIAAGPLVLPLSALIESYAVMTRLPAPHRLSPDDAAELLSSSLRPHARVAGLRVARSWAFLGTLVGERVAGGSTYDRRILEEARAGAAERLLTLDPADFERFGNEPPAIVAPGRS